MCAGGEHTKGLDTGKGLVRTFIYMNNTTNPNIRFHHLTSAFATTAGRLVAPMRSLVTKFLTVTVIFVMAGTTVFAPSAFASGECGSGHPGNWSSDDGVLLFCSDSWGINEWELPLLHDHDLFNGNFVILLPNDPGAEPTVVHLTLSNQFKNGDLGKPKFMIFQKLLPVIW